MPEKNKISKKRLVLFIIAALLLTVNIIFYSLGWFTNYLNSMTNGLGMESVGCPFEIKVGSAPARDEDKKFVEKIILNNGSGSRFVSAQETEAEKSNIIWLTDEFIDNDSSGNEKDGLQPGTSGKLTFSIIPKINGDLTITFNLDLKAYKLRNPYQNISDTNVPIEITPSSSDDEKTALDLLKGHIMFFLKKTDNKYSQQLGYNNFTFTPDDSGSQDYIYPNIKINSDGSFTTKINNADTSREYPITIYWVWSNTLGQVILTQNDQNILNVKNLFADNSAERNNIADIISNTANSKYYFILPTEDSNNSFNRALSDVKNMCGILPPGAASVDYDIENYAILSSAYNEGDQKIGTYIPYLFFHLTSTEGN